MKPKALALSQISQIYLGSNSCKLGNHVNSLCQDILFLCANLAVVLYIVMKNSWLLHFSSSYLHESRGISSAKRRFHFQAIQFNILHLNSTHGDQPDEHCAGHTEVYTGKQTNKSLASRTQGKEIFRNFITNKIENVHI